jgi:hypothetical protein
MGSIQNHRFTFVVAMVCHVCTEGAYTYVYLNRIPTEPEITPYLHALIGLINNDQHILIISERHTARSKELKCATALCADRKLKAPARRDWGWNADVQRRTSVEINE